MRRINFRIFFTLTLISSIVAYFSFTAAFARDEGSLGKGHIRNLLASTYNIVRFPTHVLLPRITMKSPLMFALGLIVNCMLYSLLLERIISYAMFFLFYKSKRIEE